MKLSNATTVTPNRANDQPRTVRYELVDVDLSGMFELSAEILKESLAFEEKRNKSPEDGA